MTATFGEMHYKQLQRLQQQQHNIWSIDNTKAAGRELVMKQNEIILVTVSNP